MTVLETARVFVDPGKAREFEFAFGQAVGYVRAAEGHIDSQLMRDLDLPGNYLFLVRWRRIADHIERFVQSPGFASFSAIVGPYFISDPEVDHFETVESEA